MSKTLRTRVEELETAHGNEQNLTTDLLAKEVGKVIAGGISPYVTLEEIEQATQEACEWEKARLSQLSRPAGTREARDAGSL
ncbi:MAG: hypothetical protein JXA14_24650 [Anaerolineae bacterium]|nr:hypothetical protein [Anaerolineae bacterium]